VLISFTTTNTTPLNPGFAGFCTEMLTDSMEYSDTNFQQITATLSPGWLRYPGARATMPLIGRMDGRFPTGLSDSQSSNKTF
jgi:hypothetical protein